MNIITEKAGFGWYAYDTDTYDGATDSEWPSNCVGHGETEQAAIADLREQLNEA